MSIRQAEEYKGFDRDRLDRENDTLMLLIEHFKKTGKKSIESEIFSQMCSENGIAAKEDLIKAKYGGYLYFYPYKEPIHKIRYIILTNKTINMIIKGVSMDRLSRFSEIAEEYNRKGLRPLRLSKRSQKILLFISKYAGRTDTRSIAKELHIKITTISDYLLRFKKAGYIKKSYEMVWVLTELGDAVLELSEVQSQKAKNTEVMRPTNLTEQE